MSLQVAAANAVIVAKQFNPSILNQVWLVDNELVARDDFRPGSVFTDMLANVMTREFVLFVAPEQLMFTPIGKPDRHQQLAIDVLCRLVNSLPHTPYTAVGLNFTWHLRPDSGEFGAFARGMFFDPTRPLYRAFDTEDARFGGYLSMNALDCRLKLDVKPVKMQSEENQFELMQFAFNYHLDVARDGTAVQQIERLLHRWNEACALAARIMETVERGSQ